MSKPLQLDYVTVFNEFKNAYLNLANKNTKQLDSKGWAKLFLSVAKLEKCCYGKKSYLSPKHVTTYLKNYSGFGFIELKATLYRKMSILDKLKYRVLSLHKNSKEKFLLAREVSNYMYALEYHIQILSLYRSLNKKDKCKGIQSSIAYLVNILFSKLYIRKEVTNVIYETTLKNKVLNYIDSN